MLTIMQLIETIRLFYTFSHFLPTLLVHIKDLVITRFGHNEFPFFDLSHFPGSDHIDCLYGQPDHYFNALLCNVCTNIHVDCISASSIPDYFR